MDNLRSLRSAKIIQLEIAKLIHSQIEDIENTGIITVTDVKLSNNLRGAKVYISIMGEDGKSKETFKLINNMKWFIRKHISKVLKMKYVPNIRFEFDKSLNNASNLSNINNLNSFKVKINDY